MIFADGKASSPLPSLGSLLTCAALQPRRLLWYSMLLLRPGIDVTDMHAQQTLFVHMSRFPSFVLSPSSVL